MFERILGFVITLALLLPMAGAVAGQLTDPTRPTPLGGETGSASQQQPQPAWRLTSTLISEDRRIAIIDGEAVGLGERVHGARVIRVEREAVWLEHQGRRFQRELQTASDIKNSSQP